MDNPFQTRVTTGNFIWLVLKNWLLGIVTLTLYRFWGRTEMRKRIWGATTVMGDAFEYTGKGMELFLGFLIAIPVFFVPTFVIFFLLPMIDMGLYFTGAFIYYLALFPLLWTAIYLMRRYQLSRTRWRGVRFSLGGSPLSFGLKSWLLSLVEGITFGWYEPAARMRRAKMLWENARFGDTYFSFGKDESSLSHGLYGPFALAWFSGAVVLFALIAAFGVAAFVLQDLGWISIPEDPEATVDPAYFSFVLVSMLVGVIAWALIAGLLRMPYEKAAMRRTAALLELDGAQFRLDVTALGLYGVSVANILVTILSLGVLAPLGAMWYVRYIMNRLVMVGEPNLARIEQIEGEQVRQGEGLADAFDLDIGIGIV